MKSRKMVVSSAKAAISLLCVVMMALTVSCGKPYYTNGNRSRPESDLLMFPMACKILHRCGHTVAS